MKIGSGFAWSIAYVFFAFVRSACAGTMPLPSPSASPTATGPCAVATLSSIADRPGIGRAPATSGAVCVAPPGGVILEFGNRDQTTAGSGRQHLSVYPAPVVVVGIAKRTELIVTPSLSLSRRTGTNGSALLADGRPARCRRRGPISFERPAGGTTSFGIGRDVSDGLSDRRDGFLRGSIDVCAVLRGGMELRWRFRAIDVAGCFRGCGTHLFWGARALRRLSTGDQCIVRDRAADNTASRRSADCADRPAGADREPRAYRRAAGHFAKRPARRRIRSQSPSNAGVSSTCDRGGR